MKNKNKLKLFGIIAAVAMIGFSMAACDDGGNVGGGGGVSMSVTVSGIPSNYEDIAFLEILPLGGGAVISEWSATISGGSVTFTGFGTPGSYMLDLILLAPDEFGLARVWYTLAPANLNAGSNLIPFNSFIFVQ